MGVAGLWAHLKPAGQSVVFEKQAFESFEDAFDAFELDPKSLLTSPPQGLRIGIDASAWFFHSESSEGGANPELRNLFHRVIRLLKVGSRPLFVFDGPHRPSIKRNARIYRGEHRITTQFKEIIESFGAEWRTAPGEAEAELAMLNSRGDIDLIISDDIDSLLFGASSVLKHAFITKATDAVRPTLYCREMIEHEADLTIPGLILVALMAGGDYDTKGLDGIGPTISINLAKGGFGDQLLNLILTTPVGVVGREIAAWRDEVRHELSDNPRNMLPRKSKAAAAKIPDTWPDMSTALRYYTPITSALPTYRSFAANHTWMGDINIAAVVAVMDELFEYTHKEILQKLRNQIWEIVIIQRLIRTLMHRLPSLGTAETQTQTQTQTPSKVLASALSKFDISSPLQMAHKRGNIPASLAKVVLRIEKARKYTSTEKCITPELQLIIDPAEFVDEAKLALRHPDPNLGKLEARKHAAAAITGVEAASSRNYKFDDPYETQKLWVPACLLHMATPDLILSWETREADKLKKKQEADELKKKREADQLKKKQDKQKKSSPKRNQPNDARDSAKSAQPAIMMYSKTMDMTTRKGKGKADNSASDDEDLFAPSPVDQAKQKMVSVHLAPIRSKSHELNRTSSTASTNTSTSGKVYHRARSKASNSSHSDIELLSSTQLGKSPKKSPRRTSAAHTARQSLTSRSAATAVVGHQQKELVVKPYKYEELSDTSSDDDVEGTTLPGGSRLSVASVQPLPKREQLGHSAALTDRKFLAAAREVIDLCSSP